MVDTPSVIKYINIFFGGIFLLTLIFLYNNSMFGFNALIYGGLEGIIFIACSLILLNLLKVRMALIFGVIGSGLIGYNMIYLIILYLIDSNGYLVLFGFYFGFSLWIFFCYSYLILFLFKILETKEDKSIIKRTILDLGTKYPRLKLKQISEKCKEDLDLILKVVMEMVKNQEIYGEYFFSSKSIVFNQQANIDEIDNLLSKFEEWEKEKI